MRRTSSGYQRRTRSSSLYADDSSTSSAFGRIRFPRKLYEAASSGSGVIRWNEDGTSIIVSERTFERQAMSRHPGLVKISSFANFRRQLRCYNFHWRRRRKNRDMFEFTHPSFVRGRAELLVGMVPGNGAGFGDGSTARRVGRKLARRPRGRPRKLHALPLQSDPPGRQKPSRAVNLKLIFQDLYEPGVKEERQPSALDHTDEQTHDDANPLSTGSAYIHLIPESDLASSCSRRGWPRCSSDLSVDPWQPTDRCWSDGEDVDLIESRRQENADVYEPDGTLPATIVLSECSLTEVNRAAQSENDYALYGAPRLYLPQDNDLHLPDRDDDYTLTIL